MLTSITVRNFKQFEAVTVELDDVVVFVGPNDSGKTTALQLWPCGNWGCGGGETVGAWSQPTICSALVYPSTGWTCSRFQ